MSTILEVTHLKKYFHEIKAVNDISFKIEKGALFGFLGVNGAGKSTTINMLTTLYPPLSGSVTICGNTLGKDDVEIRKRIGIVYQNNCLDDHLTVKENLLMRGALYIKEKKVLLERLDYVTTAFHLQDLLDRFYAQLSGGQKRRCEISRALMHAPEILFLDEPTTGLDPATRKIVWECIEKIRSDTGMTIFLTTHYMEEAAIADQIAILDAGVIKNYDTPFNLKNKYVKDKLLLYPKDMQAFIAQLKESTLTFKKENEHLQIELHNTLDAYPILSSYQQELQGFEVIQGSMDDVFLNVTGKTLEEGTSL